MTDQEKRRQKADLLLEYQEAEEELAHLKEKAARLGHALDEITKWVKSFADPLPDTPVAATLRPEFKIALGDNTWREAMNLDAAVKLQDEMKDVRHKLQTLKRRKESLGLK